MTQAELTAALLVFFGTNKKTAEAAAQLAAILVEVNTGVAPTLHAATHQDGGTDEVAVSTPTPNAIPKSDGSGKLDDWITEASTTELGLIQLVGQLSGSATSPRVTGVTETSGPTPLTMGSVPDGRYLKRSGATIIGDTGTGGPANNYFPSGWT